MLTIEHALKGTKRHPIWSEEDLKWLADNYPRLTMPECAAYLNRTHGAIRRRLTMMGLTKMHVFQNFSYVKKSKHASKI